jgi:aprataxin
MTASRSSPAGASTLTAKSSAPITPSFQHRRDGRYGLEEYLRSPSTNPRVLSYNDDFVVIKDMYPKATIHLLILPRDPLKQNQHPVEAFNDPVFFAKLRTEAAKWHSLAAKELARTLCPGTIPDRDWEAEIKVGIHSFPSMHHLHIHIISRDMHSPCVRHKKHYNSFTTPFFVVLDEFPLEEEDIDRRTRNWNKLDMICWRCGRNFEDKFTVLKAHLEQEFEEWKDGLVKDDDVQ